MYRSPRTGGDRQSRVWPKQPAENTHECHLPNEDEVSPLFLGKRKREPWSQVLGDLHRQGADAAQQESVRQAVPDCFESPGEADRDHRQERREQEKRDAVACVRSHTRAIDRCREEDPTRSVGIAGIQHLQVHHGRRENGKVDSEQGKDRGAGNERIDRSRLPQRQDPDRSRRGKQGEGAHPKLRVVVELPANQRGGGIQPPEPDTRPGRPAALGVFPGLRLQGCAQLLCG